MNPVADKLAQVSEQIYKHATLAGRDDRELEIVAVTKTQPANVVDLALMAGLGLIGENKVQEAEAKLPLLTHPYNEFHFIGRLQANKINKLLALKPTLIHSVDSVELALALQKRCQERDVVQPILIQVNTSGKDTQGGVELNMTEDLVRKVLDMPNLVHRGFMTIAPIGSESEIRAAYRSLRQLRDEIVQRCDAAGEKLSMGMSGDYHLAVEEGSHYLRLGTVLFGSRS